MDWVAHREPPINERDRYYDKPYPKEDYNLNR